MFHLELKKIHIYIYNTYINIKCNRVCRIHHLSLFWYHLNYIKVQNINTPWHSINKHCLKNTCLVALSSEKVINCNWWLDISISKVFIKKILDVTITWRSNLSMYLFFWIWLPLNILMLLFSSKFFVSTTYIVIKTLIMKKHKMRKRLWLLCYFKHF